jgi:predicted RNA binding protein YcfA (HicA-like mRNA interferase family)
MTRLPAVSPRRLIRALEKVGFVVQRQSGSHVVMKKYSGNLRVIIPYHSADIPKGTLRNILRDANLTIEELSELL